MSLVFSVRGDRGALKTGVLHSVKDCGALKEGLRGIQANVSVVIKLYS